MHNASIIHQKNIGISVWCTGQNFQFPLLLRAGGTGGTEIQHNPKTTPYHPLTECKQVIIMEKPAMVLKTIVPGNSARTVAAGKFSHG